MNYKKIIKSQSMRFAILEALRWVPDSIMLRVQYWIKLGRLPNMRTPLRYTEKLQIYKMKYHNPVMQQCVDKFEVRNYLKNKGLGAILNEVYAIYDNPEEINFEALPNMFVIKSTSGGGGNNVIVVKDKKNCDFDNIMKTIISWFKNEAGQLCAGREWAYSGIKRTRIIIEKFLEEKGEDGNVIPLTDYKFFCFNGEPRCMYIITDREPGKYAYLGVYDLNFKKLPVYRCDERRLEKVLKKPVNFEEMVDIARQLSKEFPHVRVDLYNINGKIYFGELTFYDGSGYFEYDPDSFDMVMGSYFTEY